MKIKTLISSMLLCISTAVNAQMMVHDPLSLIEIIHQSTLFLESVNNEITMIENAIAEAERQIKMMTQMPETLLNEAVNFAENKTSMIGDILEIDRQIDRLRLRVENTVTNASDIFLNLSDYQYWYDTALSEVDRLSVVARDMVRMDKIRELNRQFAGEAHKISQNLNEHLQDGMEMVSNQVEYLSNIDSTVAQLQGANIMNMVNYTIMSDMAKSIDVLTRAMTGYVYSEGEKLYMAGAADVADVLGQCPTDYYVDPFTLDYQEIVEDSVEDILGAGTKEFIHQTDLFQQEVNQLRQTGRKYQWIMN